MVPLRASFPVLKWERLRPWAFLVAYLAVALAYLVDHTMAAYHIVVAFHTVVAYLVEVVPCHKLVLADKVQLVVHH